MVTLGFIIFFTSLFIAAVHIDDRFSKLERRVDDLEAKNENSSNEMTPTDSDE